MALIRRNDRRGDNSWQKICRVESRRNCINLSSLSRTTASPLYRATQSPVEDATGFCFALHYFHIISHSPLPPFGICRGGGSSHMAWQYSWRTRKDGQWDGCYFHATFGFPADVTGYISPCSSLFRLLNYIPINNALPTLPTVSLFTIPSAAPREDSSSPGSRQIVAFIISARSRDPRANGSLRHFAFSTNE